MYHYERRTATYHQNLLKISPFKHVQLKIGNNKIVFICGNDCVKTKCKGRNPPSEIFMRP